MPKLSCLYNSGVTRYLIRFSRCTALLFGVAFAAFSAPNNQVPMKRKASSEGKNSANLNAALDSSIHAIAQEINEISSRSYLVRLDTLHLRELSSRMEFLTELKNNLLNWLFQI